MEDPPALRKRSAGVMASDITEDLEDLLAPLKTPPSPSLPAPTSPTNLLLKAFHAVVYYMILVSMYVFVVAKLGVNYIYTKSANLWWRYVVHESLIVTNDSDFTTRRVSENREPGVVNFITRHRRTLVFFVTALLCLGGLMYGIGTINSSRDDTLDFLRHRARGDGPAFIPPHVFTAVEMSVGRYETAESVPHRMRCPCKHVDHSEFDKAAILLKHDGSATSNDAWAPSEYITTVANVIAVNEYIINNSEGRVKFVLPKMWNSTLDRDNRLLNRTDFNPCVLSIRLDNQKIYHMINPTEYVDPAREPEYTSLRERVYVYPFVKHKQGEERVPAATADDTTVVRRKTSMQLRYRPWPNMNQIQMVNYSGRVAFLVQLALQIAEDGHGTLVDGFISNSTTTTPVAVV